MGLAPSLKDLGISIIIDQILYCGIEILSDVILEHFYHDGASSNTLKLIKISTFW